MAHEAYRQWVCATLVPAFVGGRRVRPCRAVCQRVEQRCPFFLPGDRAPNLPTQYAGEPTFLCLDTNIPETGEQRERSLFADEPAGECCFRPCEGGGGGGGGWEALLGATREPRSADRRAGAVEVGIPSGVGGSGRASGAARRGGRRQSDQ
ncbi:NALCN channel auxiliary factor 1 [Schistocerca serialis cubense]|uniref:NALCN channel auxiliary factor 1 n=1 Tax=Schistocerca serialis cubense TaxID=2023355 RepID=UPI00214ED4F9|nr:NALCN channel auxiliary factor 1 [Schistocerca serialis cubense]